MNVSEYLAENPNTALAKDIRERLEQGFFKSDDPILVTKGSTSPDNPRAKLNVLLDEHSRNGRACACYGAKTGKSKWHCEFAIIKAK